MRDMPRFMRSIWSGKAANAPSDQDVEPTKSADNAEETERLREAEFVKSFQARMIMADIATANEDFDPETDTTFRKKNWSDSD